MIRPTPSGLADSWDSLVNGYRMSRESRFVRRRVDLPANGNSADWHYRTENDYYRDIEKARDMDRNDAIVGQTVDRAVANIVQNGFSIDTKTGDKKLDADLAARWVDWSSDPEQCDIAGEFCFHDFEIYSCRAMLADGDCVNIGIDQEGCLQHLESHNIRTTTKVENTFLGVTKDQFGKRLKYWVLVDEVDPRVNRKENSRPVNVRNAKGRRVLFHVFRPKRMSQTRGVTAFAPIFELSGMFEDIQFAKVVQQQVTSCFAVFRQREYIPDLPGGDDAPSYGEASTEPTESGTRSIENIAPGMEIIGAPGEKLEGFSPSVPNSEYFDHVKLMLQMIGVNLGLPLCLVLMDGSETNFSGWRGAVDEARKGFRANQRNLVERLHAPLYRWKVSQWMAKDSALRNAAKRSRVSIFGHKWNAPSWSYIEPLKDAQADAVRLQNQLTSPRRLYAERGGDWQEIAEESVEDNAYAIEKAKKRAAAINRKHGDELPVHWRELINLPMPNGVQMTMNDPHENEVEQ